jgi:uncharacterized membrane protein
LRRAAAVRPELGVLAACFVTLLAGLALKSGPEGGRLRLLCYSDIKTFFTYRGIGHLAFPYVHGGFHHGSVTGSSIEYPVLTGLFMWVTARGVATAQHYLLLSAFLLGSIALAIAYVLARLTGWRAMLWAIAPGLGLYAFQNWDLLAVGAMIAGIWCWHTRRTNWAAVWFGIGCAFKLFPVLLLVPLTLEAWIRVGRVSALRALAIGLAVVTAVNLPFALANVDGWWATYEFHIERPPNIDSTWALAASSWSVARIGTVSGALTALSFAFVIALAWRQARNTGTFPFLGASGGLLAAFMLWNKVQSPQYVLWILPFIVLMDVRLRWWVAYAIADLVLYVGLFFVGPISLDEARPWLWLAVFGRALILAVLMVAFVKAGPAPRVAVVGRPILARRTV